MGGCLLSATWDEALARCNDHGARLGTRAELPVARGGGCGHDEQYVWAWDECAHADSTAYRVAVRGDDSAVYACAAKFSSTALTAATLTTPALAATVAAAALATP